VLKICQQLLSVDRANAAYNNKHHHLPNDERLGPDIVEQKARLALQVGNENAEPNGTPKSVGVKSTSTLATTRSTITSTTTTTTSTRTTPQPVQSTPSTYHFTPTTQTTTTAFQQHLSLNTPSDCSDQVANCNFLIAELGFVQACNVKYTQLCKQTCKICT
jgi:hypothetical protein